MATSRNVKNRRRKKKRRIKKGLLVIELTIFILIVTTIAAFAMPNSKARMLKLLTKTSVGRQIVSMFGEEDFNKNVLNSDFKRSEIKTSSNKFSSEKYINIALFGIDPRDGEFSSTTHTDSIIIVTVNTLTSEIRLTSVFRDTLLRMPNSDKEQVLSKANNAYFWGGPEEAINVLNENLDLDIKDYATVNFAGLATIIDSLGGIDITITEHERLRMNDYLIENRKVTGMSSPDVKKIGNIHVNGLQATAYCRNRYSEYTAPDGTVYKDDYGRTARQRFVLTQIFNKAQTAGTDKIISMAKTLLENDTLNGDKIMETSLSWDTIMDLIPIAMECSLGETQGFPYDKYTPDDKNNDYYGFVVPVGLEQNVIQLQQSLFPDESYSPSTVLRSISKEIINESGVEPDEEEETEKYTESYNKYSVNSTSDDDDDDNYDISNDGANTYYEEN